MNPLTIAFFRSLMNNPVTGALGDAAQGGMQQLGQMMGPQQAQAQPPTAPSMGQPQQMPIPSSIPTGANVSNFAQQQGEAQGKQRDARNNALARIGVPLLSAIVGTASDKALPAATGMATGYNEGFNRQEELNKKKGIKIWDEETGQIIDSGQVISATDEILKKSKTKEDFQETMLRELLGIERPTTPNVGDSIKSTDEKVKVINSSTGQAGMIPKSRLQDYIDNGYTQSQ